MDTVLDPRWPALVARDPKADSAFFYSVRTTGVYCKPSCAARLPRPENVRFHATVQDAEKAGFRPCKRCRPNEDSARWEETIARICRIIAEAEATPQLQELAREAAMSPFHFHRTFKKHTGLTPRAYAMAQKRLRVRKSLGSQNSITAAIYEAGYNSNGRFYAEANGLLGMTPSTFRAGGPDTSIRFAVGECSLGSILVASSERGVCAILLGDDPDALTRDLQDQFPRAVLIGGDSKFEDLVAQVVGMIEAPSLGLALPLDIRGTAFQQRVWEALKKIPAGTTATYTDVARMIDAPTAARAVARACASNLLAVAIPCHRVVRNDGALSGYRWGVGRKRALLEREA